MTFQKKSEVTAAQWSAGVQSGRTVGGRLYPTKAAADSAKASQKAKPPSGKRSKTNFATKTAPKKDAAPNPFQGWEATDVIICQEFDLDSRHIAVWEDKATPFKLASVKITIHTGDATKMNWRYAFSDTANSTHTMQDLVDLKAKGGHDVSYFEKSFVLDVPDLFKRMNGNDYGSCYMHFASKSVVPEDGEAPSATISARFLNPKGEDKILHL